MTTSSNNNTTSAPANDALGRFLRAQDGVYGEVLEELQGGRKRSHWMWFIFPQILGLGQSEISIYYSMKDEAEGRAYLQHPILRERLVQCTNAVNAHEGLTAEDIFGTIDALKFHSSMTLFAALTKDTPLNQCFSQALSKYFSAQCDPLTLNILRGVATPCSSIS